MGSTKRSIQRGVLGWKTKAPTPLNIPINITHLHDGQDLFSGLIENVEGCHVRRQNPFPAFSGDIHLRRTQRRKKRAVGCHCILSCLTYTRTICASMNEATEHEEHICRAGIYAFMVCLVSLLTWSGAPSRMYCSTTRMVTAWTQRQKARTQTGFMYELTTF